jgi:hypothetical protein
MERRQKAESSSAATTMASPIAQTFPAELMLALRACIHQSLDQTKYQAFDEVHRKAF